MLDYFLIFLSSYPQLLFSIMSIYRKACLIITRPQFLTSVHQLHQQFSSRHQETANHHFTPSTHVYKNIFPWTNRHQFADHLLNSTLYSDYGFLAIAKPFGVGIYTPYDKSNQPDKIEPMIFGDPRYCINDVLDLLSEKLDITSLQISHTQDRLQSGIVVLTKKPNYDRLIKKSVLGSKSQKAPLFTFHCITYGAPMMKEPFLVEDVAIEEKLVNAKTGEKEPEIHYNLSKSQINRRMNIKRIRATLKVLDYSSDLNIALVELTCNRTSYHFLRCYLASKACFILGDPRFSRRVGRVLGVPYAVKGSNKRPREEPLSNHIRRILDVPANKLIPFMSHQVQLSLRNLTKNTDLNIENCKYPEYFMWTLKRLFGRNYK